MLYSTFYGSSIPSNSMELIKSIPKEELLSTIAAINARLKPINSSHYDNSIKTQIECLRVLFLDNENPLSQSNCSSIILKYLNSGNKYNLFSRVTCLYAFQEIVNAGGFAEQTPQYTVELRELIFKYLLITNENILLFDKDYSESDNVTLGYSLSEYMMFKELPHNQHYATSNSINLFYKSFSLFKAINSDNLFEKHLKIYLKEQFGSESILNFFTKHMYTYFSSFDEKLKFNYINIDTTETESIKILDKLSEKQNFPIPEKTDLKIFEFLNIKKSPLYKCKLEESSDFTSYLVLDNDFLIEKTYSLFINDFWFDYLKPKNICKRTDWGSFIGSVFFEPFLEGIFKNSFENNKRIQFRATDDLKFKLNGRDEIEYADFYIREGGKVLLAEAKSNYLPLINGFKTVRHIADYQSINLDKFYKDYGLTQLATKTIKLFHTYKEHINDRTFNFNRHVKLYPVLIVNDPIFSTGWTSYVFRQKFNTILKSENIDIKNEKHNIMPLSIINVTALQNMEQSLHDGDINIFNIIRYSHSISDRKRLTLENQTVLLKTIDDAIDKKIKSKQVAKRIKNLTWLKA